MKLLLNFGGGYYLHAASSRPLQEGRWFVQLYLATAQVSMIKVNVSCSQTIFTTTYTYAGMVLSILFVINPWGTSR